MTPQPTPVSQSLPAGWTFRTRLRLVLGLMLAIGIGNIGVTITSKVFGVPYVPPSDGRLFAVLSFWRVTIGLLGAGLALSLFRDFDRAMSALKAGAEQLGAGELHHRVIIPECAELRGVASHLNGMAARLRQTQEDL